MLSLNQIVGQIKVLGEAHNQIKTTIHGDYNEFLNQENQNIYPAFFFDYTSANVNGKYLNVNFSLYCFDRVHHEKNNELEVFSDQLQVVTDLISQLKYPDFPFELEESAQINMFVDETPDNLGGVKADIVIKVPYVYDRCSVPSTYFYPIISPDATYPNYPNYLGTKEYIDANDIKAISVSVTNPKIITLTKGDGSTLTASFESGGGSIATLSDVTITSLANRNILRYNSATSKWINESLATYLGGTTSQYVRGDGSVVNFPTTLSSDNLIREVRNNSGATITKGTVVYINGGLGNKATIGKALATSDSLSAQTFGLVQADILNNGIGNVVVVGDIVDLDTSAYPVGTQLYLSGTTAGGYTSTKSVAPIHLVYVGIVIYSHPNNGIISVKCQNGYELDEIHDVLISSPVNGQVLQYNSSNGLWNNATISLTNIYTANGTLTGNRVVTLSTYTLDIGSSRYDATNNFLNYGGGSTFIGHTSIPTTPATLDIVGGIKSRLSAAGNFIEGVYNGVSNFYVGQAGFGYFKNIVRTGSIYFNDAIKIGGSSNGFTLQSADGTASNNTLTFNGDLRFSFQSSVNSVFYFGAYYGTNGTYGDAANIITIATPNGNALGRATGTGSHNIINVNPTYNFTGTATATIRGLYYNPTITSMTGVTHRAIELATGDILLDKGIFQKNIYTDTSFGIVNFKIGSAYELYGTLHSADGFETFLTTSGFASGWNIVIGNSTNKALKISNTAITTSVPIIAGSGISNVTGNGTLSTYFVSPFSGFKYSSSGGWTFAIRDSSDNNVLSLWEDGNTGIGYNSKPATFSKFNVNGSVRIVNDLYLDGNSITITNVSGNRTFNSYNGIIIQNSNPSFPNDMLSVGNNSGYFRSGGAIRILPSTLTSSQGVEFTAQATAPSFTMMKFLRNRNDGVKSAIISTEDFSVATATPVHLFIYAGKETTANLNGDLILQHDGTIARGSVAIGTNSINSTALFQVDSTTKGVLVPRMTSAQRTAITTPATGLLVYQTDATEGHYEYASTGWRLINAAGGGSGTVTSVSVVTANGISGSVATPTTTPAITLTLGAITPTSVNGLTLSSLATGYSIAGGTTSKTLTISNTMTLSGTDGSTLNIGTGGTLGSAAFTSSANYLPIAGGTLTGALIPTLNTSSVAPIDFQTTGAVLKTTPASGDMEVDANGFLYYSHDGSKRGVVYSEQWISNNATYTLTSQTAAQKLFAPTGATGGAVTVKASTTYFFECVFSLSSLSGTSGNFGFAIGGTATLTSIAMHTIATKVTPPLVQPSSSATQSFVNSASITNLVTTNNTSTGGICYVKGIIRVNAAGTIIPQVSMSVAAAAIVGINSFFRIIPVGTNTQLFQGAWA